MEGPLAGIEIVTVTASVAGVVAAARLRDLGARVVNVETQAGDFLESVAPDWYARLHDGVETLVADLATKTGRAAFDAALATADVLLSALPTRRLASLGYDEAHRRAPHRALIHVAIFADVEPESETPAGPPAHDLTHLARAGLLDPQALPRSLYVELAASERAVAAVLAALFARTRTDSSSGSFTAVRLADVATALAEPHAAGLTRAGGLLGGGFAGYGIYPSADGFIALAAVEPHLFERVCDVLLESGAFATLRAAFASETGATWACIARERNLPLAVVT